MRRQWPVPSAELTFVIGGCWETPCCLSFTDTFAVGPPQWQLAAGAQHSTWDEYAPDRKALLRERGWLSGALGGVRVALRRGDVRLGTLGLELGHWQGTRDYDGTTSLGTPAQTVLDARRTTLALRGEAVLTSGWSATAELQPNWLHRDLHDTANAQGYPEDWRWTLARIGLQWRSASEQASDEGGDGPGLSGHAAWGRALAPRLELRLRGRDVATLEPGTGTGTAWQAGARRGATLGAWSQAQWSAHAAIGWDRITLPASEPVPVYANGVRVGAVSQPRTRNTSTQLTIGVQARW